MSVRIYYKLVSLNIYKDIRVSVDERCYYLIMSIIPSQWKNCTSYGIGSIKKNKKNKKCWTYHNID